MNKDGPIVVVVGNPQAGSRTLGIAERVGHALAERCEGSPAIEIIDLAEHGPALLAWGDPTVAELKVRVLGARALVIATPTYKAAYTGLLKLFLDQFGQDELGGAPTVAVQTGGSPAHSLAVEVHLRPVLVELGASLPTRGVYLQGPEIDAPDAPITAWLEHADGPLRRSLAS